MIALAEAALLVGTLAGLCLVFGLASGGLASVVRVATSGLAAARRKPLGCPLCMAWWSTLLLVAGAVGALGASDAVAAPSPATLPLFVVSVVLVVFAATGLGAWLGAVAVPPPWIPPDEPKEAPQPAALLPADPFAHLTPSDDTAGTHTFVG